MRRPRATRYPVLGGQLCESSRCLLRIYDEMLTTERRVRKNSTEIVVSNRKYASVSYAHSVIYVEKCGPSILNLEQSVWWWWRWHQSRTSPAQRHVRVTRRYTRRLTVVDARYAHKRITEDTSSSSSSRASALGNSSHATCPAGRWSSARRWTRGGFLGASSSKTFRDGRGRSSTGRRR